MFPGVFMRGADLDRFHHCDKVSAMMQPTTRIQIMCRDSSRDLSCGSRFLIVSDHVIKCFESCWKLREQSKRVISLCLFTLTLATGSSTQKPN